MRWNVFFTLIAVAAGLLLAAGWSTARAHCDSMDGPVVGAAREALAKGDITPVLKWIRAADETDLRHVFAEVLAVRRQSSEAQELADRYFFETLVRIHRAGEGAPYTGLAPAGQQEPIIVAADQALESGTDGNLVDDLTRAVSAGVHERFQHALEAKAHAEHNVEAGRAFVAAYVDYVHFVERLQQVAEGQGTHAEDAAPTPGHEH